MSSCHKANYLCKQIIDDVKIRMPNYMFKIERIVLELLENPFGNRDVSGEKTRNVFECPKNVWVIVCVETPVTVLLRSQLEFSPLRENEFFLRELNPDFFVIFIRQSFYDFIFLPIGRRRY